jgi:hypothetical protein
MAGRKREVTATFNFSPSLSVEYTVFIKKIAYESIERHGVKSRFHNPGRRPVGIVDSRSLNEQHFHDFRKCWILESRGSSRFWAIWF